MVEKTFAHHNNNIKELQVEYALIILVGKKATFFESVGSALLVVNLNFLKCNTSENSCLFAHQMERPRHNAFTAHTFGGQNYNSDFCPPLPFLPTTVCLCDDSDI